MSKLTESLKKAIRRNTVAQASNADLLNGTSLQTSRGTLRSAWKLIQPYWTGSSSTKEKAIAYALLATTLGLTVWNTLGVSVDFANWSLQWGDTLQNMFALATNHKDWVTDNTLAESAEMKEQIKNFWSLLGDFTVLAGKSLFAVATSFVTAQVLALRWRAWSTDQLVTDWLSDDSYYRLQSAYKNVENPDQRIAEDIPELTSSSISILNDGLGNFLTFAIFSRMLWKMSDSFNLASMGPIMPDITIPHFMFWAAVSYAAVGSLATHLLGKKLPWQQFQLQKYNANFRSDLIRTRENAEQIALSHAGKVEKEVLDDSFAAVYQNTKDIIRTRKTLLITRALYGQLADPFPIIISLPMIITGKLTFGGLRKTTYAYGQLQSALSWFIDNYQVLAGYKATVDRLSGFHDALEKSKHDHAERQALATQEAASSTDGHKYIRITETQDDKGISFKNLTLKLPDTDAVLLQNFSLTLKPGESLIVSGPFGCGKSSIVRAMRDFWEKGSGEITLPEGATIMCSSQKTYLPRKSMHDVVSHNEYGKTYSDSEVEKALRDVGLTKLVQYLPGRQIRNAIDQAFDSIPARTQLNSNVEAALSDAIIEYLQENVDNIQSTPPELAKEFLDRMANRFPLQALAAQSAAKNIIRRIDESLMDNMIRKFDDSLSGFVTDFISTNGPVPEYRSERLMNDISNRLGRRFDKFFSKKNMELREITPPNEVQLEYFQSCIARKMRDEFAKYRPEEKSLSNAFSFVSNPKNILKEKLTSERIAGKLMLDMVLYLRKDAVTGETLSKRLSGGEQQRLSFARALLQKPDILILDEVTSALDRVAGEDLYGKLKSALPGSIIMSIAHNAHVVPFHKLHAKMKDRAITVEPVAANSNIPDNPPDIKLG